MRLVIAARLGVEFVSLTVTENVSASLCGGEELSVIMYANTENAKKAAENLRKSLESKTFFLGSSKAPYTATASFGVATFNFTETLKTFVDRCDAALYRAKKGGRNQVQTDNETPSKSVLG